MNAAHLMKTYLADSRWERALRQFHHMPMEITIPPTAPGTLRELFSTMRSWYGASDGIQDVPVIPPGKHPDSLIGSVFNNAPVLRLIYSFIGKPFLERLAGLLVCKTWRAALCADAASPLWIHLDLSYAGCGPGRLSTEQLWAVFSMLPFRSKQSWRGFVEQKAVTPAPTQFLDLTGQSTLNRCESRLLLKALVTRPLAKLSLRGSHISFDPFEYLLLKFLNIPSLQVNYLHVCAHFRVSDNELAVRLWQR